MYAIYGNIYHQYTPNVSIYIYHTWILWGITPYVNPPVKHGWVAGDHGLRWTKDGVSEAKRFMPLPRAKVVYGIVEPEIVRSRRTHSAPLENNETLGVNNGKQQHLMVYHSLRFLLKLCFGGISFFSDRHLCLWVLAILRWANNNIDATGNWLRTVGYTCSANTRWHCVIVAMSECPHRI